MEEESSIKHGQNETVSFNLQYSKKKIETYFFTFFQTSNFIIQAYKFIK